MVQQISIRLLFLILGVLLVLVFPGCESHEDDPLFIRLSPEQTGIAFENTIIESDELSFSNFPFIFNGGGVAIGDINNNGYPDILLTGNMVSTRLYLNKGDYHFEDITEGAGVGTHQWVTGASMVDINNNGFLDIYLSVMGPANSDPEERKNLLFLNNGDGTFTEAAGELGIDDTGFTTHAVFFDYNGDGYLDLYLLNNSPGSFARAREIRVTAQELPDDPWGFDKLYRNNGNGTFTNVSEQAGILQSTGYGLGIAVSDFNRNGWPDIYISNDITPNDVLYINNGDGTFSNRSFDYLKQTSFAGMGIDAADFTNNGLPDLMQTDMMPEAMAEKKQLSGGYGYERFKAQRETGLDYYYSKNALQLNRGTDYRGDIQFSEIGRMADVAYTDWSWTALFADLNNSGYKDLIVTNGYPKAVNNFDYLHSLSRAGQFGTEETTRERKDAIYEDLHGIEVPNYLFRNNGALQFENVSQEWGFGQPGFSYGAATADLNNSGALDIVINNINAPAGIYKNRAPELLNNHYLQILLKGNTTNRRGLGSELTLFTGEKLQYIYHTVYRGYQSTVDDRIHFGLGNFSKADSLKIRWPDGSVQILKDIDANQVITLNQNDAGYESSGESKATSDTFFREQNDLVDYIHTPSNVVDFNIQPLLPYKLSRSGPAVAAGDVTGNGFDDIFIGGEAGEPGVLYLQNSDGTFLRSEYNQFFLADRHYLDTNALFFDANGNGLLDLYVASGGYQVSVASDYLQDRLYINRGDGRFIRGDTALPRMLSNTSVVVAADFTGNGLQDLFTGGGVKPGNYPYPTRSYLLRNDNGRFADVTETYAPGLAETGMVNDAVWADYNNNGKPDLIIAGKWMPIQVFENNGESLRNITTEAGLAKTKGWWYSLAAEDVNGDGHLDIVAGNLGLNHSFSALSRTKKISLYAHDFNRDHHTDLIFTYEENGMDYPYFGLSKLANYISQLSDIFYSFRSFSYVSMAEIFGDDVLESADKYEADTFSSSLFINNGNGTFYETDLPEIAQISPVKSVLADDFNGDGTVDLLLAGNMYQTDPDLPRMDAGKGLLLKGDGTGNFQPVSIEKSRFVVPHDVRKMKIIHTANDKWVLVANNEGPLQFFHIESDKVLHR